VDNLELLWLRIFSEFSHDLADLGGNKLTTAERMMIDPCCQRQNCSPLNGLFNVDIPGLSSARRSAINTVGDDDDFQVLYAKISYEW